VLRCVFQRLGLAHEEQLAQLDRHWHRAPLQVGDSMSNLSGKTTIVVGASRGLGHGIAIAFADAGARVVAVSRTAATFPERANGSATIQFEVATPATRQWPPASWTDTSRRSSF